MHRDIIYRKDDTGYWQRINLLRSPATIYIDKTIKSNISYSYYIVAYSEDSYSNKSNYSCCKYISAPKLISATFTDDGTNIKWNNVDGAKSYNILRKAESGNWVCIATVDNKTNYYIDSLAEKNVVYTYTVSVTDNEAETLMLQE